mmetsp:Transcript_12893/g.32522  ORF Transcript_12893/g.32522 Transcript_12893/m.32522 type:complete len:92 (-) Transcript_12893:198-473(-)
MVTNVSPGRNLPPQATHALGLEPPSISFATGKELEMRTMAATTMPSELIYHRIHPAKCGEIHGIDLSLISLKHLNIHPSIIRWTTHAVVEK